MAGDVAEDSGKKDEKSGNQEDDEAGAGHFSSLKGKVGKLEFHKFTY